MDDENPKGGNVFPLRRPGAEVLVGDPRLVAGIMMQPGFREHAEVTIDRRADGWGVWLRWSRPFEINVSKLRDCGTLPAKAAALIHAERIATRFGDIPIVDTTVRPPCPGGGAA